MTREERIAKAQKIYDKAMTPDEDPKNMSVEGLKQYFIKQYGSWKNIPKHLKESIGEDDQGTLQKYYDAKQRGEDIDYEIPEFAKMPPKKEKDPLPETDYTTTPDVKSSKTTDDLKFSDPAVPGQIKLPETTPEVAKKATPKVKNISESGNVDIQPDKKEDEVDEEPYMQEDFTNIGSMVPKGQGMIEDEEPFVPKTAQRYNEKGELETLTAEEFIEGDPVTQTGIEPTGDLSDMTEAGMGKMAGAGNIVSSASSIASSLTQLGMAFSNKPEPEVNTFRTYAQDALNKLQDTKKFAGRARDMEKANLAMAERGQRLRNKNMARGLSSMRALDIGTHMATIGETRNISKTYYDRMESIYGKEAMTLLDRDKQVMSAEERKNERELMNRDNYRSSISQAVAGLGETGANIGKQMNTTEETKMAMQIAGNSGKWGDFTDYMTKLLEQYKIPT